MVAPPFNGDAGVMAVDTICGLFDLPLLGSVGSEDISAAGHNGKQFKTLLKFYRLPVLHHFIVQN